MTSGTRPCSSVDRALASGARSPAVESRRGCLICAIRPYRSNRGTYHPSAVASPSLSCGHANLCDGGCGHVLCMVLEFPRDSGVSARSPAGNVTWMVTPRAAQAYWSGAQLAHPCSNSAELVVMIVHKTLVNYAPFLSHIHI